MKLILEIKAHGDDERPTYHTVEKFPVTIGRGLNNDIILNDTYVSPRHLDIEHDGETFFANDLGSTNGVTVSTFQLKGARIPIRSGMTLHIGQTEIRIYRPDHPVADALRLQRANPVFPWLSRSYSVWGSFILMLALALGWAYLEIWTTEVGLALAATATGAISTIVLWSAAWSVAGRLTKRKSHFKSHVTIICLYMSANTLAWYLETYADFLTSENWLSRAITYSVNFVLLVFLLYGGLTLSTLMTEQRRRTAAAFCSLGLVSGVLILGLVSIKSFNQMPLYPSTLKPYLSQLAPADTLNEFTAGNEAIFRSFPEFKDKKKEIDTAP